MEAIINGERRSFDRPMTVSAILAHLRLSEAATIVEHNGAVLSKARFGEATVHEGDRLELIQLVGGG